MVVALPCIIGLSIAVYLSIKTLTLNDGVIGIQTFIVTVILDPAAIIGKPEI